MGEKHSKSVENPKKEKEIEPQAIKDFDTPIPNPQSPIPINKLIKKNLNIII